MFNGKSQDKKKEGNVMGVGFNNTDEIIISGREFRNLVEAETRRNVAADLVKSNIFESRENIYLVLTGESLS